MTPRALQRQLRRAALATAVAVAAAAALVAPAGASTSLVRVAVDRPAADVPALRRLGLDVTEAVRPGSVDVLIHNARDGRALRRSGFSARTLIRDVVAHGRRARAADARALRAPGGSALPSGRETYRTYEDYLHALDALVAGHPGVVRRVVLPLRSLEGREIVGVEIARDVGRQDDGRPVQLVFGAHHAREWPSAEVAMEFAIDLARGAASGDPRITTLLSHARVYVVPVVNADGFVASRASTGPASQRRKDCRPTAPTDVVLACPQRPVTSGVDLNRNFGAFWGGAGASTDPASETYRGPGPWSEPEAEAVHELSQHLQVTGLISLHNFAGLVLRPPGVRALGATPDEARLKELGDAMGAATGYSSQHGYELYDVTGATEDWNYAAQGAFGYTIELGGSSFQDPYQQGVVDQYVGAAGTPQAGKGVREALLLGAEVAADATAHGVLAGTAAAGATLRLHRSFTTTTSPVCGVTTPDGSSCLQAGDPLELPEAIDTTLVVPADGRFTWHVGPSTRPFEAVAGRTEAWTLTCERDGQVVLGQDVVVGRGQRVSVSACGGAAPTAPAPPGPPATTVVVDRQTRAQVLRKGLRVRVLCTEACSARIIVRFARRRVGVRNIRLRDAGSVAARVRLTTAGRRGVRRTARPVLTVAASTTASGRPPTTTTLRVRLR